MLVLCHEKHSTHIFPERISTRAYPFRDPTSWNAMGGVFFMARLITMVYGIFKNDLQIVASCSISITLITDAFKNSINHCYKTHSVVCLLLRFICQVLIIKWNSALKHAIINTPQNVNILKLTSSIHRFLKGFPERIILELSFQGSFQG